ALSRAGAFIRQRAKSSIRRRRGASRPGNPPHSHTGYLRNFIFFGYEPATESVVIGPVKLNQKNTEAPRTLEHGGTTVITEFRNGRIVRRKVTIAPRRYMGPALDAEQDNIPRQWAGVVVE
ncbi:MAG: hypothetical protein HUU26_03275, partial [Gemmatimonadaceae bacterium]|nr:hypothetical protein [Gemmatimonadaceae bacterium]